MKKSRIFLFSVFILVSSCKNKAEEYFKQGNDSMATGVYKAAVPLYDKAIALKPDYAWAYGNRGSSKIGLEDYAGALKDLNKALKLDPKMYGLYYSIGLAKEGLKDTVGAKDAYNIGIKLNPKDYACYIGRADLKEQSQDYIGALNDYNQSISLHPKASSYHYRGLIKIKLNDKAGACADLNKALELGYKWAKDDIEKYCK